ncbi:hypothetical protein [Ornithinimicrobium murale]|uniref:hypothetical protein n=1 Tax=Ornithinimicrobium murale TaxID=1050153 RepID=UPI000E0DA0EB|nr:hypothetical protein [Ornithinimicrobium murale]
MTTTKTKTHSLLLKGWVDRGLGDLDQDVSAKLADVLAAAPNTREKAPTPAKRVAYPTTRGIALGVSVGKVEAGVHLEAASTRMELFITAHDSEPGLRLRTGFDAQLAADMLADPRPSLITKHDSYQVGREVGTAMAEEG